MEQYAKLEDEHTNYLSEHVIIGDRGRVPLLRIGLLDSDILWLRTM